MRMKLPGKPLTPCSGRTCVPARASARDDASIGPDRSCTLAVAALALSPNADILCTAHAEPLRRAAREVEPGALCVGNAPGPPIVDADGDRTAVPGICHGQRCTERPGARGRGVAVGVEAFAACGVPPRGIRACQDFLPRALAGRLDVFVNRAPSRRVRRREREQADEQPESEKLHAIRPCPWMCCGPVGQRNMARAWCGRGRKVREGQLSGKKGKIPDRYLEFPVLCKKFPDLTRREFSHNLPKPLD
jgi:hypothetical protein